MIKRPRKEFEVAGLTLRTSSYTKQTQTDWCVGVGDLGDGRQVIGDSKTRTLGLSVPNGEMASLLAALK